MSYSFIGILRIWLCQSFIKPIHLPIYCHKNAHYLNFFLEFNIQRQRPTIKSPCRWRLKFEIPNMTKIISFYYVYLLFYTFFIHPTFHCFCPYSFATSGSSWPTQLNPAFATQFEPHKRHYNHDPPFCSTVRPLNHPCKT